MNLRLPIAIIEEHITALTEFDEFLNHNELGLAADWLRSIVTEDSRKAIASIESLILAERNMGRTSKQKQLEIFLTDIKGSSE